MKTLSMVLAAVLFSAGAATAGDLTLSLTTEASGGKIAIALYRDAESLRRDAGAVRTGMVDRTGPVTTTTQPRRCMVE